MEELSESPNGYSVWSFLILNKPRPCLKLSFKMYSTYPKEVELSWTNQIPLIPAPVFLVTEVQWEERFTGKNFFSLLKMLFPGPQPQTAVFCRTEVSVHCSSIPQEILMHLVEWIMPWETLISYEV